MNYTVFQWFNNFADSSKLLDTLMVAITNSAAYVAILFMLILWFNNGKKDKAIRKQYTVLYTTLSVIFALLVNVLNAVYYHPRPFVSHDVHQLVPHAADSSFVSDHSVLVFSIVFVFILRGEKLKYIALLWAVLVGISRMYVGVHYPLDILGAAFLTLIMSALVMQSARMFEPIAKLVFKMYALVARRIPFLAKYNHIA
ncbi:Bacitracin transport permease protein BCRC [Bacillus thuringiensis serovar israelensis ATCC 35646]|nr:Bacitracin transport permease protein BCRC [Bacillus thuringiensis serovar israelensis ATCC 35646]